MVGEGANEEGRRPIGDGPVNAAADTRLKTPERKRHRINEKPFEDGRIRAIVPQEPRHLLNGNAMLQKHMHDVVSAQKREQWTAMATEDEKFQFEAHSNMDHLIPLHTVPTSPCLVMPNTAHRAMMRVAVLLPDETLPSFSGCACGTRIKGNSPWAARFACGGKPLNEVHTQCRH